MEENSKQRQTDIIKIAIYGPESTGKTTLAKQLADRYNTVWTPEYAREFLQEKWDSKKGVCTKEDLVPIALGQVKLENEKIDQASTFLFSDTCVLLTKVYSDLYFGSADALLEKAAKKHKYDLFLFTDIDIPWEKDDLRDTKEARDKSVEVFEKALVQYNKPYLLLSGNQEQRLQKASAIIDELKKAKDLGLNSFDFLSIYKRSISLDKIAFQWNILINGMPKTVLNRAAVINDGILSFSEEEIQLFVHYFEKRRENLVSIKFVPASGAASRMFKFLNEFVNEFKLGEESINAYINRKKDKNLSFFLLGIDKFPFYMAVLERTKEAFPDYNQWSKDLKYFGFIKTMLSENHFDFANKPKGVLPFHQYSNHIATAIEEHIKESGYYTQSNNKSNLHFTISEEHQNEFDQLIDFIKNKSEGTTTTELEVTFSYQDKATDTVALNLDGTPFRDENDAIVFRPGGHGALIDNLNQLDADLVFIKNIDNVIHNNIESIALYKKALAGILLEIQGKVFHYLEELDALDVANQTINEVFVFLTEKIKFHINEDFPKYTKENIIDYLRSVLNRPIRVCGMVKNEGEPGGGPFWVNDGKGNIFLQIVETSQVDVNNPKQKEILNNATHFNPVDLVCGIKNYKGVKFNLHEFVDHKRGFIVEKNKNGKALMAYELPGLWNGAMAKWLTVFVEVPLITFNPVKTVNDLLKPNHQPE